MFKKFVSKFIDKTFLKFVFVGIINTLVGTAIMFTFYNIFNFSYWVSTGSNYFFTSILSFILNKYFTFSNKKASLWQVFRFALNIAVCYFLAYGVAKQLVLAVFSLADEKFKNNLAMLAGMVLFAILNYTGQRFFCFSEKYDNK